MKRFLLLFSFFLVYTSLFAQVKKDKTNNQSDTQTNKTINDKDMVVERPLGDGIANSSYTFYCPLEGFSISVVGPVDSPERRLYVTGQQKSFYFSENQTGKLNSIGASNLSLPRKVKGETIVQSLPTQVKIEYVGQTLSNTLLPYFLNQIPCDDNGFLLKEQHIYRVTYGDNNQHWNKNETFANGQFLFNYQENILALIQFVNQRFNINLPVKCNTGCINDDVLKDRKPDRDVFTDASGKQYEYNNGWEEVDDENDFSKPSTTGTVFTNPNQTINTTRIRSKNDFFTKESILYLGSGFASNSNDDILSNNETNIHLSFFTPFIAKKNFSFGVNFAGDYSFSNNKTFNNNYNSLSFIDVDFHSTSFTEDSKFKHSSFQIGVGPQANFYFGNKFIISPIFNLGYFNYNQKQFAVQDYVEYQQTTPANFTRQTFQQETIENSGLYYAPRLRMSYKIFDNFSFWAEANMNFYNLTVKQNRWIPLQDNVPNDQYSWMNLIEGSYQSTTTKINQNKLGFNFGLAYSFGGKTHQSKEISTTTNTTLFTEEFINETKISQKDKFKTYFIDHKEYPTFTWSNADKNIANYVVKIFDSSEKVIYQKETKNTSLSTDNTLKDVLNKVQKNKRTDFSWIVTTIYKDGKVQDSEANTLKFSRNDLGINVDRIECLGFTENGTVRYGIDYTLVNHSTSTQNWIVNTIKVLASDGSTLSTISSTATAVTPGNSIIVTNKEIEVPTGTSIATIEASGTRGVGSASDSYKINLPQRDCICNICSTWKFRSIDNVDLSGPKNAKLHLSSNIQIVDSKPIMKVKAEIISFETIVNQSDCEVCSTSDDKMGMFFVGSTTPSGGHLATGNLWNKITGDVNGDGYANALIFEAKKMKTGVDFSTQKVFMANIALPDLSQHSNCKTSFRICIRYTFTDIDCKTCDYVICYNYSPTSTEGEVTGTVKPGETGKINTTTSRIRPF